MVVSMDTLPRDLLAECLSFLGLVAHVRARVVSSNFDKAVSCSLHRLKRVPTENFSEATEELRRGIVRTVSESCRSLTELTDLTGMELLADLKDIFRALSHALTSLQTLQARKIPYLIAEYPELQFPELAELDMYCMYDTAAGCTILESILSRCPKLKRFRIISPRITTRELETVVQHCPKLQLLTFSARFSQALSLACLARLRDLETLVVHSLSVAQARELGDACPQLKNLALAPFANDATVPSATNARRGLGVLECLGRALRRLERLAVEFFYFNAEFEVFAEPMTREPHLFPALERLVLEHASANVRKWDSGEAAAFTRNSRPGLKVVPR